MFKLKDVFGKRRVFTKPIQKVKHYLNNKEIKSNTREVKRNKDGLFVEIPKCNFDVEIVVDAIRLVYKYDTFCLFSGDADFIALNRYLSSKGKKIILVKGGYITTDLRKSVDLVVNA